MCIKMNLLLLLFFTVFVTLVNCSNILIVVPVPSKSHVILFDPLVLELGRRGHQVTYVSAQKLHESHPNVNHIFIPVEIKSPDGKPTNFLSARHLTALDCLVQFPYIGLETSRSMVQHPLFQKLLKDKPKFDLLLQEAFVSEGLMAGLSKYFNVPFIGYATFIPSSWTHYMVGNVAPTSFLPEPFTGNPPIMNFWQRTGNFLYAMTSEVYHKFVFLPLQDELMRTEFSPDYPYVEDIIKNMSVLMVNDHVSTSFPRPAVPNMIGIGGLHVEKPKPLPKDIQAYLDNSKKGAILFSLGSNVRAALMSKEKTDMFLKAFSQLEQNILWKFEEELENVPKNVMISKWLPQADILAHPNIKLFITHGGLLSTTEAIDRGVPIVGIPIFGDQPINMKISVSAGVGLSLDFDNLSAEELVGAVNQVIKNPKYAAAAKQRSRVYHDRITPPMELAIWWTEYVIRHNGAGHLRSTGQDLAWDQWHQLDVILFLGSLFTITLLFIFCLLRGLFRQIGKIIGGKKIEENKKHN